MKRIIAATDFSENAAAAVAFSFELTALFQAELFICHALSNEGSVIQADQQLDAITNELDAAASAQDRFCPAIVQLVKQGELSDMINDVAVDGCSAVAVIGMSGAEGLFTGNHTNELIGKSRIPLFIIPPHYQYKAIRKICFATDLEPSDIPLITAVTAIAKYHEADIFIYHTTERKFPLPQKRRYAQAFKKKAIKKSGYAKIIYSRVKSRNVDVGLNWINEHGAMDLMVMVHRERNAILELLTGSHTMELAGHTAIPLLVLPESGDQPYRF